MSQKRYTLNESACKLVAKYFMDRYQWIKVGCVRHDLLKLSKGAHHDETICLYCTLLI